MMYMMQMMHMMHMMQMMQMMPIVCFFIIENNRCRELSNPSN